MNELPDDLMNSQLRVQRLVLSAMIGGIVMLTGISVFLVEFQQTPTKSELATHLISLLAAMTLGSIAVYVLIGKKTPAMLKAAQKKGATGQDTSEQLLKTLFTTLVIRGAVAEGSGLFGALTYMLTGNKIGLGGTAIAIVLLMLLFPTHDGAADKIREARKL